MEKEALPERRMNGGNFIKWTRITLNKYGWNNIRSGIVWNNIRV